MRRFLPRIQAPRGRARLPARGYQAVRFVDNTRRYYDTLRWLEGDVTGGSVAAYGSSREERTPVL